MKIKLAFVSFGIIVFILGCVTSEVKFDEPRNLKNLEFEYSNEELFVQLDNELAKLGRVLFYDELLSKNGKVSCASCHRQQDAFADQIKQSPGFLLEQTELNTPTLINLHFAQRFFYKSSTRSIEVASTNPILNAEEMGLDWEQVLLRINGADYYEALIQSAFQEDEINELGVGEALGEFLRSIVSTNSKFDLSNQGLYEFTEEENDGRSLFNLHCEECHRVLNPPSTFSNQYYSGSNSVFGLTDIGLEIPNSGYSFRDVRIPTLRNLKFTAPYMHDGRFTNLQDVIEHYNSGVNLDKRSSFSVHELLLDDDGNPQQLELTDEDKLALEAFLNLLNDETINTDEKFSNPFTD